MKGTTNSNNPPFTRIGDWVLYKNNQLIAFNKPPGIPVQGDKSGDKSLLQLGQIYCQCGLYPVHRIDRPASGVVIFAKNKKAAGLLSNQFANRTVEKIYLAVVKNKPAQTQPTIRHFLTKNQKINKSFATTEQVPGSQLAEMTCQLLGSSDHYHLLQLRIHTGRHHQIRSQLAALGCPIKGDVKYGARRSNKDRSIHLHAWKLAFRHPVSNENIQLVAPPPADPVWDFFRVGRNWEL